MKFLQSKTNPSWDFSELRWADSVSYIRYSDNFLVSKYLPAIRLFERQLQVPIDIFEPVGES